MWKSDISAWASFHVGQRKYSVTVSEASHDSSALIIAPGAQCVKLHEPATQPAMPVEMRRVGLLMSGCLWSHSTSALPLGFLELRKPCWTEVLWLLLRLAVISRWCAESSLLRHEGFACVVVSLACIAVAGNAARGQTWIFQCLATGISSAFQQ